MRALAVYKGSLTEEESISARLQSVHTAVRQRYPDSETTPYTDPHEVFNEFVIVRRGGELFKIDYESAPDGAVTLAPEEKPMKVEYVPTSEALAETEVTSISEYGMAEIAETEGTVAVTIIRPGWSSNGRYYSAKVLAAAIPLFEGSLAYVDHPTATEQKERPGRSVLDVAGYFQNVHAGPVGEIKATLILAGQKAEAVKSLIEVAAKDKPDLIGISINGVGKTRQGIAEGRKGMIVEAIVQIHSSDIVTNAAAGGTFDRLIAQTNWAGVVIAETSFEQWKAAHPEWKPEEDVTVDNPEQKTQEEFIKAQVATALAEGMAPLQTRVEDAEAKLATAQQRESARDKLEGSALPRAIHSDLIEELTAMAPDAQDARITAEITKITKLGIKPVVTGAGAGAPTGDDFQEQEEKLLVRVGILTESGGPRALAGENYRQWYDRTQKQAQSA